MTKRAVPQRRPAEGTVAERRPHVFGLAQIDTAEVAFGEHYAFGPQPSQIVVAKIVLNEFPFCPNGFGFGHARQPGTDGSTFNAYSVTAMSAAVEECRSLASTVMIGMSSDSASALRTSCGACLGASSNSLIAIRNGI
jgi:hypothetical protein